MTAPSTTRTSRGWLTALALGVVLCAVAVAMMVYVNVAATDSQSSNRFDGAGTFFAAEMGLAHEGSRCQIAYDGGASASVDLPAPAGASTYDTRYVGQVVQITGPATVTCQGRKLLVGTGLAARLLDVNHLPGILFVVGAVLAVIARVRLKQRV